MSYTIQRVNFNAPIKLGPSSTPLTSIVCKVNAPIEVQYKKIDNHIPKCVLDSDRRFLRITIGTFVQLVPLFMVESILTVAVKEEDEKSN